MIPSVNDKDKLHNKRLIEFREQEKLLIRSGAVFNLLSSSFHPVSDVAIAMELEISVAAVRQAIQELAKDGLVSRTLKGDWEVSF